jgi:hypothetical protein
MIPINQERLVKQFMDFVRIDSPIFAEAPFVHALGEELSKLGLRWENDRTGQNGAGNLLALLPGTARKFPLFSYVCTWTRSNPGGESNPGLKTGKSAATRPPFWGRTVRRQSPPPWKQSAGFRPIALPTGIWSFSSPGGGAGAPGSKGVRLLSGPLESRFCSRRRGPPRDRHHPGPFLRIDPGALSGPRRPCRDFSGKRDQRDRHGRAGADPRLPRAAGPGDHRQFRVNQRRVGTKHGAGASRNGRQGAKPEPRKASNPGRKNPKRSGILGQGSRRKSHRRGKAGI